MYIKFNNDGKVEQFFNTTGEMPDDIKIEEFIQTDKRFNADDIYAVRLMNNEVYIDEQFKLMLQKTAGIKKNIADIEGWFISFYRPQLEQAQRAQRTNTEWHTSDGVKTYYALAELDAEANNKQNQVRALKAQLQG